MNEYAFDVKLWAIVRVKAENEKDAIRKMYDAVDCVEVNTSADDDVLITQASMDDTNPLCFEVNGVEVS